MLLSCRNNYEKPTPIQAQAIPVIMSGRDMIGMTTKWLHVLFCLFELSAVVMYLGFLKHLLKNLSNSCVPCTSAHHQVKQNLDIFLGLLSSWVTPPMGFLTLCNPDPQYPSNPNLNLTLKLFKNHLGWVPSGPKYMC